MAMSGAFALPSDASSSSVLPWPDAATSASDSTRVPDGLSSASACAPRRCPHPSHRTRGTERHPRTTWPEVERSADSTLIDRRSGTVGTDIEATAESRLTADPNSTRSDLESSAIFAGTDSDYGGIDRRLIRVVAWIAVVILVVAITKSAKSGIGGRDAAAYQQACSNHAGACE